ncbi:hypothetical protein FIBSPDRAFT_873572 [Athelia psychrophila]|uniref:Uncharacterized protein n=1 Tax=Athelia psychrophila TaxID=1759441 RepID=A0A165YCF0_9AGAM|nr:hypothetical protein FIBSPDRAFT_873564 [Fibularhizoctonia sp. CBS 109695]KZP09417.1 hypothetical protein FIBSPDRAFT_873572 [Fibularhizoctonia sp. CBS 109695]
MDFVQSLGLGDLFVFRLEEFHPLFMMHPLQIPLYGSRQAPDVMGLLSSFCGHLYSQGVRGSGLPVATWDVVCARIL